MTTRLFAFPLLGSPLGDSMLFLESRVVSMWRSTAMFHTNLLSVISGSFAVNAPGRTPLSFE